MKLDVIGDVHGCLNELKRLFGELGYTLKDDVYVHPEGRVPVFVGDITDRGPSSVETIRLVYRMVVERQAAKYVPGNHCNKLYRYFLGNKVQHKHGLETTIAEYTALPADEQEMVRDQFMELYEKAPLYMTLPEVVVAHAGIREDYIGRTDKKVKSFVLYGDTTGKFDEHGRPIRRDWAKHYQGNRWIVYGHTPVMEPRTVQKTINIDTGCVFGNKLSAFQLPEEKTVSVPSEQPFLAEKFTTFT